MRSPPSPITVALIVGLFISAGVLVFAEVSLQRLETTNDAARTTLEIEGALEAARFAVRLTVASTIALMLGAWLLAQHHIKRRTLAPARELEPGQDFEHRVAERTQELFQLSSHLQQAREEERATLSRDLHDELGGILVSARLDITGVRDKLNPADPAAARLARAVAVLDQGVDFKRRLVEALRPTLLDNLGLAAALEWLVSETCKRAQISYEVQVPEEEPYPDDVSIALFRIAQEALANAIQYSQAKQIIVELSRRGGQLALAIRDDGIGIPEGAGTHPLSHGISGMRHRVSVLGGSFLIRRRPTGGTAIEVILNLAAAPGESQPDHQERVSK